jgi:hypothetical protein
VISSQWSVVGWDSLVQAGVGPPILLFPAWQSGSTRQKHITVVDYPTETLGNCLRGLQRRGYAQRWSHPNLVGIEVRKLTA